MNAMDGQMIIQFLSDHGYWLMLPLMIIEGPIVTLIAAFMASFGVFNIFFVFAFSMLGDILGDVLLYGLGRKWGMHFVDHIGKHVGITRKLVMKMEKYFAKHGGKTVMIVKSTTGLCWATWVAAGIIKMHFGRFVWYSFLGGVVWSVFLVFMGYFFGYLHNQIADYISYAGWIIGSLAGTVFIVVGLLKRYETKKIFVNDNIK